MTRQDLIAVQLMEELAEIQQAISKALRFGFDNHHPEKKITNAQDIGKEWGEAYALMEMLVQEVGEEKFAFDPCDIAYKKQRAKVEKWLEYSESVGRM